MIVADTNVIVYLHINGPYSRQAEQALKKDPIWVAPRLWRSEFRNVLALQVRQRVLTLQFALGFMEEAARLLQGFEHEVPSTLVLRLADSSGCSAYDCEFVVLAQDFGVPLVTMDSALLRRFPDVAISLDAFLAR